MKNYLLIIITLIIPLLSCNNEEGAVETVPSNSDIQIQKTQPEKISVFANIDYLRLRSTPGEEGEVVAMVSKGDELFDLEKVSDFTTRVKLRGVWYDEPWLLVETRDGKTGWVYGGGVNFNLQNSNANIKALAQKRLKTLFTNKIADSLTTYNKLVESPKTAKDLAYAYRVAKGLQKEMNDILSEKIVVDDPSKAADLSWIKSCFPGFIIQLVAEGTQFHLFADYKYWYQKSKKSLGAEDNEFYMIQFDLFPIDSIEHFYPAWFIQTWDYGGHSELGKGVHFNLLEKINKVLAHSDVFEPELEEIKNQLMDDITKAEISYWYDKKAILQELDQIIASDFGLLSSSDKIALEKRREQFESAAENGIKINQRSGE